MVSEQAINLVSKATGHSTLEVFQLDNMQNLVFWDSIAHLNIMLTIEEIVDRRLTASEIIGIDSISGIQSLLDEAGKKKVNV